MTLINSSFGIKKLKNWFDRDTFVSKEVIDGWSQFKFDDCIAETIEVSTRGKFDQRGFYLS